MFKRNSKHEFFIDKSIYNLIVLNMIILQAHAAYWKGICTIFLYASISLCASQE